MIATFFLLNNTTQETTMDPFSDILTLFTATKNFGGETKLFLYIK